jgi:leucyl aminopeptidase
MDIETKKASLKELAEPLVLLGYTVDGKNSYLMEKTTVLKEKLDEIIEIGDFTGKKNQTLMVYTNDKIPTKRIFLVGLGKEEELTDEIIRTALGKTSREIRERGIEQIAIFIDSFIHKDLKPEAVSEAIVEGILLGSFQNLKYKTEKLEEFKHIKQLTIAFDTLNEAEVTQGSTVGKVLADAVNFSRELSWGPANDITPTKLAAEAERLAKEYGIKTTVFDRKEAQEKGLHSFLAVAQGTEEPPKFIIMEYQGKKDAETVALIGKAITFDTGGISIKPSKDMGLMKADMSGGATVLAAMEAIARLKPRVNVLAIIPATDNMPSGRAYHPGDIIKTYHGQTVEVISTDAEGRMVLIDALTYAAKNYKPAAMFDFATLTGSMVVALGTHAIGYFSNHEHIVEKIEAAAKQTSERVWRMPLWDVYDQQLKSDLADLKHTGGRAGGAITAARFLSKFTMDVPWAHFDIAGVMQQESDSGYNPKGSKGAAVRLIVNVIKNWKE